MKYTKKILNFKPTVPEVQYGLTQGCTLCVWAWGCAPPLSAKIVDKTRKRKIVI